MTMKIAALEGIGVDRLAKAFNVAFADYAVPMVMTEDRLAEMLRRRGFRPDLSVGAFEGEEIVGFTLTGLGMWRGLLTGYDTGTGVVAAWRGRGLAREMMDAVLSLLRGASARQYLLEVIRSNEPAVKLYQGLGFHTTREFECFQIDPAPAAAPEGWTFERRDTPDWDTFGALWNHEPSWQNAIASIARAGDEKVILVAIRGDKIGGYAIVFPSRCDLAQLAVAPEYRRRGLGRALLTEARQRSSGPLKALNVEAGDTATVEFMRRSGAKELPGQYEMILPL